MDLTPTPDHVLCRLRLDDLRDLTTAIARCRRLLDLDADPEAVDGGARRRRRPAPRGGQVPGRRIPGTVDEAELAVRMVLGQQVSTAAARTHAARLVAACGTAGDRPRGGLTHLFPSTEALADIDLVHPRLPARREAVAGLVDALASGVRRHRRGGRRERSRRAAGRRRRGRSLDRRDDRHAGPGRPRRLPVTDLGVRRAPLSSGFRRRATARRYAPQRWRPWRSYAVQYLWGATDHPVNHWPPKGTP